MIHWSWSFGSITGILAERMEHDFKWTAALLYTRNHFLSFLCLMTLQNRLCQHYCHTEILLICYSEYCRKPFCIALSDVIHFVLDVIYFTFHNITLFDSISEIPVQFPSHDWSFHTVVSQVCALGSLYSLLCSVLPRDWRCSQNIISRLTSKSVLSTSEFFPKLQIHIQLLSGHSKLASLWKPLLFSYLLLL